MLSVTIFRLIVIAKVFPFVLVVVVVVAAVAEVGGGAAAALTHARVGG